MSALRLETKDEQEWIVDFTLKGNDVSNLNEKLTNLKNLTSSATNSDVRNLHNTIKINIQLGLIMGCFSLFKLSQFVKCKRGLNGRIDEIQDIMYDIFVILINEVINIIDKLQQENLTIIDELIKLDKQQDRIERCSRLKNNEVKIKRLLDVFKQIKSRSKIIFKMALKSTVKINQLIKRHNIDIDKIDRMLLNLE
jgi:hypothetical protein